MSGSICWSKRLSSQARQRTEVLRAPTVNKLALVVREHASPPLRARRLVTQRRRGKRRELRYQRRRISAATARAGAQAALDLGCVGCLGLGGRATLQRGEVDRAAKGPTIRRRRQRRAAGRADGAHRRLADALGGRRYPSAARLPGADPRDHAGPPLGRERARREGERHRRAARPGACVRTALDRAVDTAVNGDAIAGRGVLAGRHRLRQRAEAVRARLLLGARPRALEVSAAPQLPAWSWWHHVAAVCRCCWLLA